ncbi:MAG: T9SS type A sorting domain-containing protein [Bacteroidota bacterium]
MKKNLLLLVALIATSFAFAQVNVTSSGGTPTAAYTTLATAFAAVDSGLHTGIISIGISANTTETVSATLIASGSSSASYTSISISPTGGASRTITGAITGHLIDLNGARNVTINGLNSAGNALTISNTATGASSCIRFIADASLNTVTNCTITGSTTSFGNIFFSTGNTNGNDSNTISNNNIGVAGSNYPVNGVYSLGTSSTIENNNNTISSNNIFDFFSATAVTSGINVNSGNSNWIISNNKLYQTATRTYTTGNTHNIIIITSGNGYAITNNTIGYAAANATGVYTLAGTIATRFIGINLSVGTSPSTSVQGNTIAAISLATSSGATTANGVICGINITSGNVNVGTNTGNVIGSNAGVNSIVATPTTTGGLVVGINSSSTGTIDIQNNVIGALSCSGTTATIAGSITGVNVSGAAALITISGNTIGNSTANNMRGGTVGLTTGGSLVSGVNLPSTPTTALINNNTIQNLISVGASTSSYVRGVQTTTASLATAVNWSISNNTINNLTTNSTLTGISSGLCSASGIHHLSSQGSVISQNSISNISNTNTTATTNILVAGIVSANAAVTTSLGTVISRNKIWGLSNASIGTTATAPPIVAGIAVRSGNNIAAINNNMISLGNGQTTNTSFIGIWCNNGSTPNPTANIYYNTVNIEGTATSGALPSFAFLRAQYVSTTANTITVDVKYNIFQNNRNGGTGQHFAISNGFNSTTVSATGWAAGVSNYNVLNANVSTVGHWTSVQTFSGWKTASASDANSISNITTSFVNSASGDLHLNMGTTPTQIESGGAAVSGINNDFDNDVRQGSVGYTGSGFAPDLGADEFNGVQLDLNPPSVSLASLGNSPVTLNRTVSATITDANGVRISTDGPKLYYKKTTDNNTLIGNTSADNGWKYVSATNVGSLFTFNIDYSILNGGAVAANDTIQYFIVAMDSSPNNNIVVSNGTLALTTTSTILGSANFPITGLTSYYRIVGNLSGVVTVGVGGTYSSFTNAGGLFDDINNKYVNGNITAQVISDISTELGSIGLLEFNTAYQLSIVPDAAVLRTVSTTSAVLFGFLGADNVTIDGRSGGSGKYLLLQNNNTSTTSIALLLSNITNTSNGCQNINIRNTLFESGSTNLSGGTLVNNIHIQNNGHRKIFVDSCEFKKAYNGAVVGAGTVTINYDSLFFTNNIFGEDLATKYLTFSGIQLFYTSNSFVKNNIFKNLVTNLAINNSSILVNTGCSNVVVEQNRMFGNRSTNTGLYGTYGISVLAGTNITIKNNAIYNINSASYNLTTTTDNTYGIRLAVASGVKIYNNSISIDSASLNTTSAQYTACIANFGATGVEIVNNILRNAQTGFTGSKAYALYLSSGTVTNASNNVLYTTGPNAVLSLVGTTDYASLPALQAITSSHANSSTVNPNYTDANSNLTPLSCIVNNSGIALSDVTNDINGTARSSNPDIGAFEFTPAPITAPTATSPINYCKNSSTTSLSATGVNTLIWYTNAVGGVGNLTAPIPTTTTPGSINFYVADSNQILGCVSPRTQIVVNISDSVYNNTITSSPQTICSGSTPASLTASTPTGGDGTTYTYSWLSSTTSATAGFAAASGTNNTQNYTPGALTASTWYRRRVTSGSCAADTTAAVAVTVNAVIADNTIASSQSILSGATPTGLTGALPTGGNSTYTYTWLISTTSATTGFSAIGSSNTQNYSPGALTANTWYRRLVVSGSCSDTSSAVAISVTSAIANNTISGTSTICSGSTPTGLTGALPTGATGTYTYTWLSSTTSATAGFSVIASSNTQNYSPGSLTQTTWYRRYVVSGAASDTSTAVTITVNTPGIWGGTVSAAWNNTANWTCPQIPTSTTNVTISSGATNMPTITDVQQCNNLTINSGATLTLIGATAQLNLYGAFTNNGTFTNSSTGKTVFSGSTQQTVPAGNYTKLQINNATGVILGGAVVLSDSLLLSNGILTLDANNLTLGASSYASAGSATSFIRTNGTGSIIVNGVGSTGKTGSVRIPVGNATYNPAILVNTGTTDNYTVRLFDSVTTNYTGSVATGAKLTSNALNRTWIINEGTAGGSNATVTLQWNTADELSGFNRALCYVARYNGTVWMSTTSATATGSNPYTQTRSGITSFSPFSVGSGGTLPVELVVFAGTRKSEKAYLRWTTASEINNDYFIVERSLDNKVFEPIGQKIKGQGNSNNVNQYESVDADAMNYALANNSSTVYYRLRQVDFDGSINYSKSISILFDDEFIVFNATISPNPFDGLVQLNVLTNNEAPAQIEIIDIKGLVVYSEKLNFLQGNSNYVLHNLDQLAEGMYFIKVKQGIDVKVIKATKTNSIK